LFKLGLTLAALAICNAVLAILMPWYIVTRLGIGIATDAFFVSGALPQLIFMVASFSLTQVLVPLLATESGDDFRRDAWALFLGITAIFSVIAAILFVTAPYWVSLIVPGFSIEAMQLATTLSRIQLLTMIGNAVIIVLWSDLLRAATVPLDRAFVRDRQRHRAGTSFLDAAPIRNRQRRVVISAKPRPENHDAAAGPGPLGIPALGLARHQRILDPR
jgi:hypothetical protein